MALTVVITAMTVLEGIGAERNYSRSLDPHEPREPQEWEQALLDELLFGPRA